MINNIKKLEINFMNIQIKIIMNLMKLKNALIIEKKKLILNN